MKKLFLFIIITNFFFSCNLEKEIEIEIPEFEQGYVVESYIQPAHEFGMLITKSSNFFETFDSNNLSLENFREILSDNVSGNIKINNQRYPLYNELKFIPSKELIYNYTIREKVQFQEGDIIELELDFPTGESVFSSTIIPQRVDIDSVELIYNDEGVARELTYISTDSTITQYFRRQVVKNNTDSSFVFQDFTLDNKTSDNGKLVFGSGYDYYPNDTLISRFYHINKEYFDFLNSVNGSVSANTNPFGQPGRIYSNITGSNKVIGIFTGINRSEIEKIIEE